MGRPWDQLDHVQVICTSLQTDNHASTSPQSFYRPDALLLPNQQHQSLKNQIMNSIVTSTHRKNLVKTRNSLKRRIHLSVEKPVLTCSHKNPGIHLPVKIHNTLVPVQNP